MSTTEGVIATTRERNIKTKANYRGNYWPIALLVGMSSEFANAVFLGNEVKDPFDTATVLGLHNSEAEKVENTIINQLGEIKDLAETFWPSEFRCGKI